VQEVNPAIPSTSCSCARRAEIRHVDGYWRARDWLGALRVRIGVGRSHYRVAPGLYATGPVSEDTPVFVTGNYKLSFDHLRRALAGIPAWILVVDTHGVNVWCAAAKGSFSAAEVVERLKRTRLADRVRHRRLVLPQLAAPGVAAHEVRRASGFQVEYGPVRAADLPVWLAAGGQKTPAMRQVSFTLADRLTLAPVEITNALRSAIVAIIALGLLAGLRGQARIAFASAYAIEWLGTVLLAGVLVPLLLPWLPSRAFSVKGAAVGLLGALAMVLAAHGPAPVWMVGAFRGAYSSAGAVLLVTAYAAWLALNFTGATVFTSQSGTLLETKRSAPAIAAGGVLGFGLQLVGAILQEAA
jgi:hypothetical protein